MEVGGSQKREGIDRIEGENRIMEREVNEKWRENGEPPREYDEAIFDPRDRPRVRQVEPSVTEEEEDEDEGPKWKKVKK